MTRVSRVWRTTVALGTLVVALAACTGSPVGPKPPSGPASERPMVTAAPPSVRSSTGGVDQVDLDRVFRLAATESGQDPTTLTVVSAESVTWPNGALGCPKMGVMYTEALVEGYRVVVSTGDRELDYRMSRSSEPRLCERPGPAGASGG